MTLAGSPLACGRFEPFDLVKRFVRWWAKGAYPTTGTCFDIGITTAHASGQFEGSGDLMAASTAETEAGNGSLMRPAPVMLAALLDPARIGGGRVRVKPGHSRAPRTVEQVWFVDLLGRAINGKA